MLLYAPVWFDVVAKVGSKHNIDCRNRRLPEGGLAEGSFGFG